MRFLILQGIRRVVAPMIESPFAMRKYQDMLVAGAFDHVGVTIETIDAVRRIEEILEAGANLTEVTVGRTDLTASYGGSGVDSDETVAMVKTVGRAAARRGLPLTMGGSVNAGTVALLQRDAELRAMVHCVETRKCVMPVADFLRPGALETAFRVEAALLDIQLGGYGAICEAAAERKQMIMARL
jgi:citrate lyase beta subunit